MSKHFRADARVNGSIMRIHRDTRFSKDKRPYKTGLFIRFPEGKDKSAAAFGIHVHARGVGMMGGCFGFDDRQLATFRSAVLDAKRGAALERAIAAVEKAGASVNEPHYKRVPRGLDADHARADLLRHRTLHASLEVEPVPKALHGPRAVGWVLERFERLRPLQRWLAETL